MLALLEAYPIGVEPGIVLGLNFLKKRDAIEDCLRSPLHVELDVEGYEEDPHEIDGHGD